MFPVWLVAGNVSTRHKHYLSKVPARFGARVIDLNLTFSTKECETMWQMFDIYKLLCEETYDIYTWFHIFVNGRVAFPQFRRRMVEIEPNVVWKQLGRHPKPVSIPDERRTLLEEDEPNWGGSESSFDSQDPSHTDNSWPLIFPRTGRPIEKAAASPDGTDEPRSLASTATSYESGGRNSVASNLTGMDSMASGIEDLDSVTSSGLHTLETDNLRSYLGQYSNNEHPIPSPRTP